MVKASAVITFTGVLVGLVYYASAGVKQEVPLKVILSKRLVGPGPDILVTSAILNFPPGDAGAPAHFHSGPTIGYVIEGELLFQMAGQPIRIIRAGEAFYELDRETHVWGGNASNTTTCRIFATVFGRPDENFITFIENYKRESREEALAIARKNEDSGSKASKPVNSELKK